MEKAEIIEKLADLKLQVTRLGHRFLNELEVPVAIDKMKADLEPFCIIEIAFLKAIKMFEK